MSGEARELSANERLIIRQRHYGWEHAEPGLLAAIFGVSVQRINSILRERPPS